jgi:acetoin utilization protein AcuB
VQIKDIIDTSLFPLKSNDTVDFAMETFISSGILGLPVVSNLQTIGFVDAKSLLDQKPSKTIVSFIQQHPLWEINESHHYYEAIRGFGEFEVPCLAVFNNDNHYTGIVSGKSLCNYLTTSYTQKAEGSVLCVEMSSRDYSLTELSRIIENNDAKILGVTLFSIPESARVLVNIKINTSYIERIVATLQRFGYEVKASFFNKSSESDFENRYHSLIKYLEF